MRISKAQRELERKKLKSIFATVRIVKTVILLNFLLLLFSISGNGIAVPFLAKPLVFKSVGELFSFELKKENTQAAKLIDDYEGGTETRKGAPSRGNVFFNPVIDGNSPLDAFFTALENDAATRLVRIAHFGDSQIEGDRISSQLRDRLQKTYGGSGYGFVPLADIAVPISYERTNTENFIKYNVFSQRLASSSAYGLSGSAFRFVYQMSIKEKGAADSSAHSNTEDTKTVDTVKRFSGAQSVFHFAKNRSFNSAFLLFGKVSGPTILRISGDKDSVLFEENLSSRESFTQNPLNRLVLPAGKMQRSLRINVSGDNSTIFTGLYLDSDHGVQVDNYSIRGHSGNGLLMLDEMFVRQQAQYLETKLVILQYGGNSVPYIVGEKGKEFVQNMYTAIIAKIRRLLPDASILIVGVGDMAKAVNGEYRSYEGLRYVRDALKETAMKNNCAFWDVYEMMGGENSILTWAERGLAAKDGHFSIKGEDIVAKELAAHLETEFEAFKKRRGARL